MCRIGLVHRDLDDARHDLLVEDLGVEQSECSVGHQARHWIVFLESNRTGGERDGHHLNVAKARAYAGTAQLDGESHGTDVDAARDVVGRSSSTSLVCQSERPFDPGSATRNLSAGSSKVSEVAAFTPTSQRKRSRWGRQRAWRPCTAATHFLSQQNVFNFTA
ncbi:MAG: hypothetical protein IIA44_04445 [Acidobacteria bacterium]|nr:hypothetical protein [Acidobacteriota bacterium]